jgi:Domain of unknown function (DUF4381)
MESGKLPLRDIHLPEAISWWPPALGWWLLAILIPLLLALFFLLYKKIIRKTAIKTAKQMLSQLKKEDQLDNLQKLTALSALLRRAAMSKSGRKQCAGLTGQQWLEYLDSSVKGSPFTQGIGKLLANAHYQNKTPTDPEIAQLIQLSETWLNAQK